MSALVSVENPSFPKLGVLSMNLTIDKLGVRHRRRMNGKSLSAGPWVFEYRYGHDLGTSIKYWHG